MPVLVGLALQSFYVPGYGTVHFSPWMGDLGIPVGLIVLGVVAKIATRIGSPQVSTQVTRRGSRRHRPAVTPVSRQSLVHWTDTELGIDLMVAALTAEGLAMARWAEGTGQMEVKAAVYVAVTCLAFFTVTLIHAIVERKQSGPGWRFFANSVCCNALGTAVFYLFVHTYYPIS